ncbi:hypothetical protein PBI_DEWDROP_142 [Microbacterium phage Dewdrop]|nr:hypothetical protein PBI_LEAF_142 [Microbacterium phage Leaf]QGZ17510.1 hypothetical protein PBI_DEWDROP_142 [Microbacterium phage Dewdrop]
MADNTTESAGTEVSITNDLVARLQNELRKAQPFPDGTLIRFASVDPMTGQHYHYAALFAAGKWWFTGQGNKHFPTSATQSEFSALMVGRGHTIVGLEMATAFTPIEL